MVSGYQELRALARAYVVAAALLAAGFLAGYGAGCARWHHDHLVCHDGACWTQFNAPQPEEP